MKKYNKLILADNLDVLPRLQRGAFDFIYLDPPFNKNKMFRYLGSARRAGEQFAGEDAFLDVWEWDDECERIAAAWNAPGHRNNELFRFVGLFDPKKETRLRAYLTNMAVRLALMKPLLSRRGSIYLHCDPTVSHYLKVIMDLIFGRTNFRNEVVWHYQTGGASSRRYAKKHDVVLFYSQSKGHYFDAKSIRVPRTPEVLRRLREGAPGATRATDETKLPMDVITDIPALNAMDGERTGYTTQKPTALLERFIKASCPEDGVVLDPFCGCGTTIDAAIHTARQFVGVDINKDVPEFIKARRNGALLFEKIDIVEWKNLLADTRQFNLQASEADENRAAEVRIAKKMNGAVTPRSGDAGVDVQLKDVVVSVKNGLSVQLNALREIEGVAARHKKRGVLALTRREVPESWRKYANDSKGKIAVVSETDLDSGNIPEWLRAAIDAKKGGKKK